MWDVVGVAGVKYWLYLTDLSGYVDDGPSGLPRS